MNTHLHKAGLAVAASIPLFVLPARISEGQLNDPVNLIGSEIVIFLMSLTCWYSIHYIRRRVKSWKGIVLSVLCCCFWSNVFFFTFNPYFKDFPFRTSRSFSMRVMMLSSRGVLMSIVLIPAAVYLKRDYEARFQRRENERLALERIKVENELLEEAVAERTHALHQTLHSLEESQQSLKHQLYVQSRLVASITHDIGAPFNYLLMVSRNICELLQRQDYDTAEAHSAELTKSLETMYGYVKNLLEFTKLPVEHKLSRLETIHLGQLVVQKSALFKGVINSQGNTLELELNAAAGIVSNPGLLGVVLHNLIDNANKHTRNGRIVIRSAMQHEQAHLSIENTGNLVPPAIVQWFNSKTEEPVLQRDIAPLAGIGLILVKEISTMLGIAVCMRSDERSTAVELAFQS